MTAFIVTYDVTQEYLAESNKDKNHLYNKIRDKIRNILRENNPCQEINRTVWLATFNYNPGESDEDTFSLDDEEVHAEDVTQYLINEIVEEAKICTEEQFYQHVRLFVSEYSENYQCINPIDELLN